MAGVPPTGPESGGYLDDPSRLAFGSSGPAYSASAAASPGPTLSYSVGSQIPPTVSGIYGYAWSLLWRDFITLFIVGLVYWLLAEVVSGILSAVFHGSSLVDELYGILVGGPLSFGLAYAFLDAVRGRIPTVNDLWRPFQRNYVQVVITVFLWEVVLGIGFVLLIIPGIILAIRLCFVPYISMNEGTGAIDALKASWDRTSGYSWIILGAGVVGIIVLLVGLILLVVGLIPASMLVALAFAALYLSVSARKGVALA